jgi:internalin A
MSHDPVPASPDPLQGWRSALRLIKEAKVAGAASIDLSGLNLSAVPDLIAQLTNLQALHLSKNQLGAIPDSIAELTNLQFLYLHNNRITAIPDSLARLANLRTLFLDDNQLTTVPDSLARITQLGYLDLSNNQLTALPDSLQQLTNLTHLFLHGNPGLGIPDEILGPTLKDVFGGQQKSPKPPREILAYYYSQRAASRPLEEAKLILVGQGGVGKTSLVKKVTTGVFDSREETTQGIKISDWYCELSPDETVTVHIWDFGGQEMMHATHQFFLTARSLYLLVLNRRPGGVDREADSWFRLIRAFGGKDAPVVVVLNKQRSEPFDVNRGAWLEKYAGNVRGFVETDCLDDETIRQLQRKIREQIGGLKDLRVNFPRRWFAVKGALARMATDFITFADYRKICEEHGEKAPEQQTLLAGFLHDLGIALNYRNDPRLRFAYVLKPEWVTHGIYALIHAFVQTRGLFSRAQAGEVLTANGYSPEATDFLLALMEQFELSFALGDRQNLVLIPQLLEDQQPDAALEFQAAKCLNFGYQYSVVPEGLLPRFIVRTHHLSQPSTRWKSGVILRQDSTGCRALVRTDAAENQVRIHIDGPEASRRELLAVIRYNFDVIHSDFESKPEELVYPVPETSVRVGDLEALRKSGEFMIPVVRADKTVVRTEISTLVIPRPQPLKLFLSYSHADEEHVNELRKDLKVMERNGLIRPWHDRALKAGEKWEARILQELTTADVIVCQLSRDFLASDFCVLTELDIALRRKEAGEAELIAYVLKDCGWKETRLAQFQILPRDVRPLRLWDKDEYWRAIAEGIEGTLKGMRRRTRPAAAHSQA